MTTPDMQVVGPRAVGPSRLASVAAAAVVVLSGIASIVVLSMFFDRSAATYAAALPAGAIRWGLFVSSLASVERIYITTALLAAGALVMRRMAPGGPWATALRLVAERSIYVAVTLGAAQAVTQCLKFGLGRARPRLLLDGPYHFELLALRNDYASFPSGHSTTAFAMALALSLIAPRLRVALFTLALAVALSRIVVGAHFASDIASGAVIGTLAAVLTARAFAAWNIAFARTPAGVALKGPGQVAAALAEARRHSPPA